MRQNNKRLLVCVILLLAGCSADRPLNPSLPLLVSEARLEVEQLEAEPTPLERPLVVLSGIHDPGFIAAGLKRRMGKLTGDGESVIAVSFFLVGSFDRCRDRLIDAVEEQFPSDDPAATIEVDVIGFSMGGLVARHAARPREDGKRLRIRTLFTISTPHQGSGLARLPTFDSRVRDMRPGSLFLSELDETLQSDGYALYTYCRLGDIIVSPKRAAPPGQTAWWVKSIPLTMPHMGAPNDPRILADIIRRLRGLPAIALDPPSPLPDEPEPTTDA